MSQSQKDSQWTGNTYSPIPGAAVRIKDSADSVLEHEKTPSQLIFLKKVQL